MGGESHPAFDPYFGLIEIRIRMARLTWDKADILQTLKKLHKEGKDLSYTQLSKKMQPLVSAAAYHFGSYRNAVEKAGIPYSEIVRRPRWTKQQIIKLIKQAKR